MVSITNMGGDPATKIDELIENIPEDQLEILRKIWEYFLQNKEWPKGKPFRKEQGRLTVERVVTDLKPIFIWHMDKNNLSKEYYRLTTEGVFAVEGFEGPNIKLLLSYLDCLRKKFDENAGFEKVTAKELRENLDMNSEDTRRLGELLDMGNSHLWGSSASNLRSSDWEVGVIDDIENLYDANSSQEFLFKKWDDNIKSASTYRPSEPSSILGIDKSQASGLNIELEPPIEIQENLARFKRDYPDPTKVAFIMMQFGKTKAHDEIVNAIRSVLDSHGIRGVKANDKEYHGDLYYNIMTYLYGCGFGIAVFERIETEKFNPNVSFEVGYMFALKKHVCLLKDKTLETLHTDLVGKLYKIFDPQDPGKTIPGEISQWLSDKGIV
ncbi:MAG: hypothetical protein WBD09_07300 [Halobacteriota archaeon]